MSTVVSQYTEQDADDIAALFNRYPDNPNPLQGSVSGDMLHREIQIRRTAAMFVARDGDQLIATLGLFRSTGRRTAGSDELLGDMFYVAPTHRQGLVTGQIFHDAMMWLMETGFHVLGLTVNPANTIAFQLYRRAGCVSITSNRAGDDGNVELYNFTPLILHSILPLLDADTRKALAAVDNIATLSRARSHDDPDTDVVEIGGVSCVEYEIALTGYVISAAVDVRTHRVLPVTITSAAGDVQILDPVQIGLRQPPVESPTTVLRNGELTCRVEANTGTVELFTAGHHGPLVRTTWPSLDDGAMAGWRRSRPVQLEILELDDDRIGPGLQLVQRLDGAQHRCEIRLGSSVLEQQFQLTDAGGQVYQEVGLRRGTLSATRPGSHWQVPLGVGIGLRDSSEMFSAARPVEPGDTLTWAGADGRSVATDVGDGIGLVHSRLLDRQLAPGTSVIRTTVPARRAADPLPEHPAAAGAATTASGRSVLRLDPVAGGVTAWKLGAGQRVLRTAWPRTRSFGSNPRWSAGMWVTRERSRFDREQGLGWGTADRQSWRSDGSHTLTDSTGELQWSVRETADGLQAVIEGRGAQECVLWSTPITPAGAEVYVDGGRRFVLGDPWVFWTRSVSVSLGGDLHLTVHPDSALGHPEIAVRSSASGLLLGCVQAPTDGIIQGRWCFRISSTAAL